MYFCLMKTCQLKNMYNLRSGKQNTVIPIEIQLAEDKNFIETLVKHNIVWDIDNNTSDSDASVSELDCSGLMNDSDEGASSPFSAKNSAGTCQTVTSDSSLKNSEPDMQQLINARILDLLEKIGDRLDKIENKECKKMADKSKIKSSADKVVKTKKSSAKVQQSCQKPKSMADETLLQLRVDQRLQELSDLAKAGTFQKMYIDIVLVIVHVVML